MKPRDGGPLPLFHPGQYITVKIEHPQVATSPRNYSLSDRPGVGHFRISVKREPSLAQGAPAGVVSNYLHDDVREGDTLLVGPPCGEFTIAPAADGARPIVLLSGGIGITPVLSMFKSLLQRGTTAPIHFVHAARNGRTHALASEVREAAASRPNVRMHFRYDEPDADDLKLGRCDATGFVDGEFLRGWLPSNDAEFYFCGPAPFMRSVYRELRDWGVEESQIHFEFFGPRQEIVALN